MDRSEPSSSGINGAVPKKKRKSEEENLSSSQRSMNWRQQQKELDPEGFRERERLRTRERRQNRQGNQTANQTTCSTNMSSKETQTDITVSVNEILRKLTPLSDSSGRYKLVDQMDGTGNGDLIFEENDIVMNTREAGIQETHSFVIATTSSHRQRGNRQCGDNSESAEVSPLVSDLSDIGSDQYNAMLPIISSGIHATFHDASDSQTAEETVGRSIKNNPADGNPNDVDAISKQFGDMETECSSQIPSVRDTRTSTDPCREVATRGQKQTIPPSDGNSIESSCYLAEQEIPTSPPLSVTSMILDMEEEAERPSSKKILVTSNDDTTECTGGDIQLNEGSKSDTVTFSESQMPLETVGNLNEDSPPAGNPNDVNAISKPIDDMETASSPQASIRKSTDPRPEVTTRDINCNGERGNADGKKDTELKAPYKRSGQFTFYSNGVSKNGKTAKRDIVNMLAFQDKIYIRMEGMKFIEEVSANGKVGNLLTFENFGKDMVVNDVAISQKDGAIWFCCDDNSVNKYLDGKCTEIFRTNYPPMHLYIESSNLKEKAYVCHETGLEIWDEDGAKSIPLYRDSTDSNGEKVLYYPGTVDKDSVSGRVLVTSRVCVPMLLDESLKETDCISTLPAICEIFRICFGCFNHKGNILLGATVGLYVLSGVNFEVLTILNSILPSYPLLCLPSHDLWCPFFDSIYRYSYTGE